MQGLTDRVGQPAKYEALESRRMISSLSTKEESFQQLEEQQRDGRIGRKNDHRLEP